MTTLEPYVRALTVGPLVVSVEVEGAVEPDAAAADVQLRLRWSDETGDPALGAWTISSRGSRLERKPLPSGRELVTGTCRRSEADLQRAVRFATQPALLCRGWLLLHASSVRLADGVHVFAGASGVGKSTLAKRLAKEGAEVLGDEIALVGHGRVEVHPMQALTGRGGGPLATIHLLEKGEVPAQRPLRPVTAVRRLLSCAMVYEPGPQAAKRALGLVEALVCAHPVVETRLTDDERALEPFRSVLPEAK